MTVPFDCLSEGELLIAHAPPTVEEAKSQSFSARFPREYVFGLRHVHYLWRKLRMKGLDTDRVLAFSDKTTKYRPGLRLVHIAHLVQRLRPRVVYEFGAGVSTVMFAQLLQAYGGKIISFEQSPSYYNALQGAFPEALRDSADIRLAPVRLRWFGGWRGIYFDVEPPSSVDLIYVDGPSRTRGSPESDFAYPRFNADLVRLREAGTRIGYAFSDHRWANCPFWRHHMPEYQLRCSRWWKSIIVTPRSAY